MVLTALSILISTKSSFSDRDFDGLGDAGGVGSGSSFVAIVSRFSSGRLDRASD